MRCQRCEGLMVKEWLYDPLTQAQHVQAERCVNCGSVREPVIETNQRGAITGRWERTDAVKAVRKEGDS